MHICEYILINMYLYEYIRINMYKYACVYIHILWDHFALTLNIFQPKGLGRRSSSSRSKETRREWLVCDRCLFGFAPFNLKVE